MFAYTVRCEIASVELAEEWIEWMRAKHIDDVLASGARSAQLVRLDGSPVICEARYVFDRREEFERYEREEAPRLRAEGLERFPLARGLRYERTTGEVIVDAERAT